MSDFFANYVHATLLVGWEAGGRMPSVDMTAMGNPKQEILMALGLLLSSIVNANAPKQDKKPDTAAAIWYRIRTKSICHL